MDTPCARWFIDSARAAAGSADSAVIGDSVLSESADSALSGSVASALDTGYMSSYTYYYYYTMLNTGI